jgi:hypothetical protein
MPKITIINLSGSEIGTIDVDENQIDLVSLLPPVIDIYREQHKQIAYKIIFDETILFEYNGKYYNPNYKPINISSDTHYTIIFEEPDETVFNGLDLVQLLSYIKFINFKKLYNNILRLLIIKLKKMFKGNGSLTLRQQQIMNAIVDIEERKEYKEKIIKRYINENMLDKLLDIITINKDNIVKTESFIDFILLLLKEIPNIFKKLEPSDKQKLIEITKNKSDLLYKYNNALKYLATIPSLIDTSLYDIINSKEFVEWANKRTAYITKIKEYKESNKLTESLYTIAETKEFKEWLKNITPPIEILNVFNKYIKYKTKYQLLKKTKLNKKN